MVVTANEHFSGTPINLSHRLWLSENLKKKQKWKNLSHFSGTPINLSHSSVHVPTDVFDGEEAVINAIDWSRKLEDTFKVKNKNNKII